MAQDIVPYECAILSLCDPSRGALRITETFVTRGNGTHRISHLLNQANTHIGWVFKHKTTLLCRDLEGNRFPGDKQMLDDGYRCACSVPLIVRDSSLGVLSMLASKRNRLSANHAGVLEEISKPIALAINSLIGVRPMNSSPRALQLCSRSASHSFP